MGKGRMGKGRNEPMRTVVLALIAFGAMALPGPGPGAAQAQAQPQDQAHAPQPAAASPQVFWVFTLAVEPDQYDQLKQLVGETVAAVAKDPGALEYEWNISADHRTLVVVERYADSAAVVQHGKDFGPFAQRFFALAKPTSIVVFGAPDANAKKALAGLHPVYMTTFDGFTR